MDNFFDLDFDAPVELTNYEVKERDLYDQLIKDGFIFSASPDGVGSAYIMKDGKFLFLEQNRKRFDSNVIAHGALDLYLQRKGYVDEDTLASRILCQTDNAIRINDGKNFAFETIIGLPKNKITTAQVEALESWLQRMFDNCKYNIAVGNELVSEVFRTYDLREVDPEYITSRINTYYRNGILREAQDIKRVEEN